MIWITETIFIREEDFQLDFIRASGPGGQNVNKVSTAVQLRFDVEHAGGLSPEIRTRLKKLAGRRMTSAGMLIINARRFRTQERNRLDALDRLAALIRRAAEKPKPRRRTRPTRASRRQRLDAKRKRSVIKKLRGPVSPGEER